MTFEDTQTFQRPRASIEDITIPHKLFTVTLSIAYILHLFWDSAIC